jgi:hypothetical protein
MLVKIEYPHDPSATQEHPHLHFRIPKAGKGHDRRLLVALINGVDRSCRPVPVADAVEFRQPVTSYRLQEIRKEAQSLADRVGRVLDPFGHMAMIVPEIMQ